jgi:serine/threonine protein phosphatase 1
MPLPSQVNYPVVAIPDLHGNTAFLRKLLTRLAAHPEWPACKVVFLGDFCDRGPDVKGCLDLVLQVLRDRPGSSAVAGNHDLAPVRAARLDGGPPSPYWMQRYRERYDHAPTFKAYLGRGPDYSRWEQDLDALREAMPAEHREFLAGLNWLVEAPGHLFLHCGLSPHLLASAAEQIAALRQKRWDRSLRPRPGSKTEELWQAEYPVWLGADKSLSDRPLPVPGRVQVTGHVQVPAPEVSKVRIRLDTSGGFFEPLTACLLTGPDAEPIFIRSDRD